MINVEPDIFNAVATAVTAQYPNVFLTSEYSAGVPSFPCISLVEIDNTTHTESMTQAGEENHADLTYELNVYSNKTSGKKSECRELAAFVDAILLRHNFQRTMLQPVQNLLDATVYRITGRYRVVADADKVLYRR